jgi:MFS family permease
MLHSPQGDRQDAREDKMADTGIASRLTDTEHRGQLYKAVIAATVGTTIEWYDFFLYSTAAGLVFPQLFFPNQDPYVGVLAAFGTYFIGFVGRPIGAAIFGHYGDRIGRKGTLIFTLLLMGLATFAIALVPGYARIGIWGAVALTALRLLQGIGVGGEWGGSVLISMEWARTQGRRGLIASWPQFGVPAGLFLANLAILGFSAIAGKDFITWGWRAPFALSLVLIAIGLWIRLGILETPVFRALLEGRRIEAMPTLEAFRKQPREIVLSALSRMAEQSPFYIFTAFVFAYATKTLHYSRNFVLSGVLVAAALAFVVIPLSGHWSDRIGRRRMFMLGALTTGLYGYAYFFLLDTGNPLLVFAAIALSLVPHAMMYGPLAALIAEAFTPRLRYSGSSLGYQFASIIAGGPAPLVATALFQQYRSGYVISGYIAVCAVISIVASGLMPDYTGKDISAEYDSPE